MRARYRAEARFRLYGLLAIGLTAMFLVVVLTDIVIKGLPAFTQHQLDAAGEGRCRPRSIRRAPRIRPSSAPAISRRWCATRCARNFPRSTDRAGRRLLDGMLSSGAADELRDRVVADPALIGQTVKVPVLLSDDADLYYKGIGTRDQRAHRPRHRDAERHRRRDHDLSTVRTISPTTWSTIKQALSVRARDVRTKRPASRSSRRKRERRRCETPLAAARAPMTRTRDADRDQAAIATMRNPVGNASRSSTTAQPSLQARFDNASGCRDA